MVFCCNSVFVFVCECAIFLCQKQTKQNKNSACMACLACLGSPILMLYFLIGILPWMVVWLIIITTLIYFIGLVLRFFLGNKPSVQTFLWLFFWYTHAYVTTKYYYVLCFFVLACKGPVSPVTFWCGSDEDNWLMPVMNPCTSVPVVMCKLFFFVFFLLLMIE